MTSERTDADDLHWLAFRYVAGELDPDAADAFEGRLDEDQAAREAVAAAVGLVAAMDRAGRPHKSSNHKKFRRAVVILAAAASLLLGLSLTLATPRGGPGEAVEPIGGAELAWTGLQASDDLADPESDPGTETPEALGPVDDDEPGPPSWLLEAVALWDGPEPAPPGF